MLVHLHLDLECHSGCAGKWITDMNHSREEVELAHEQGEVLRHELEFPDGHKLHKQIKKSNVFLESEVHTQYR